MDKIEAGSTVVTLHGGPYRVLRHVGDQLTMRALSTNADGSLTENTTGYSCLVGVYRRGTQWFAAWQQPLTVIPPGKKRLGGIPLPPRDRMARKIAQLDKRGAVPRIVEQPEPGITKKRGAFYRGERAEKIVGERLTKYAAEKAAKATKRQAAAKKATKRATGSR